MPTLLILGSSTRAAAFSARRADWTPRCVDEFGDRDLAAVSTYLRAGGDERLPAFEGLSGGEPGSPWIYTGPIENHFELVETLAARHRLLGNSGDVLRSVRDPLRVSAFLRGEGLAHADVRPDDEGLPRDGSWLGKPFASGGGRGIECVVTATRPTAEPHYYQRFVDGQSISAIFVADRGSARPVGVTRQLHGGPGGRFAYRGNVGPIAIASDHAGQLDRLGAALVRGFGLMGLFGVDGILRDGEVHVVEINPRYTASVEVLELALGRSLLREHLEACGVSHGETTVDGSRQAEAPRERVVGKEVLYADRAVVIPELPFREFSDVQPFVVPELADVPWPGTTIGRGEPIMTVLAEGRDEAACVAQLRDRVAHWSSFLAGPRGGRLAGSPQA